MRIVLNILGVIFLDCLIISILHSSGVLQIPEFGNPSSLRDVIAITGAVILTVGIGRLVFAGGLGFIIWSLDKSLQKVSQLRVSVGAVNLFWGLFALVFLDFGGLIFLISSMSVLIIVLILNASLSKSRK